MRKLLIVLLLGGCAVAQTKIGPEHGGTGAANTGALNKVLIGDGTKFVEGDPLVQGTTAEGAAIPNPVVIGGKDGSGNNKALTVDASGNVTVNIAATQSVVATQGTASNLKAEVVFPSAQSVNATLAAETTKVIGTVNIASGQSLAANQSVNVAQINGVTPLMGNGTTGTGSQRVTVASDNTPFAVKLTDGTGTAVICNASAVYDTNTNGKTTLVAASGSTVVYVCGFSISQSTTSAVTVSLGSGTGSNCVTTYAAKTPAYPLQAPTSISPVGIVHPAGIAPWFQTAAGENLCLQTNAAVSVQVLVQYIQR